MKVDRALLSRCIGEIAGTATLMGIGCMGCTTNLLFPRSLFMIAISFGLAISICVHTYMTVSGAHVNPSISIAFYVSGKMPLDEMLLYCVMQVIGGLCGYALLLQALPQSHIGDQFCVTRVHASIELWQGLGIEFVLTSVLVYFCCSIWDPRSTMPPDSVPVRFGFLIAGLILSGGHYTGASLNIARTLPPSLFMGDWEHVWVYAVGQFAAAILTPLAWRYLHTFGEGSTQPAEVAA